MRQVKEWIGRTDDTPVPPRVRLRIFERHGGRCHISGRLIRAGERWDCEHIISLVNGGEHREYNLAPALVAPHKEKTKLDVAEKALVYRKRAKHLGIKKKTKPMMGSRTSGWKRKMDGTVVKR